MSLSCGCNFSGGMPVTDELLKEHYKHTMEAMFFWEMIRKPGRDPLATLRLSKARMELLNAIDELYPQAKEESD